MKFYFIFFIISSFGLTMNFIKELFTAKTCTFVMNFHVNGNVKKLSEMSTCNVNSKIINLFKREFDEKYVTISGVSVCSVKLTFKISKKDDPMELYYELNDVFYGSDYFLGNDLYIKIREVSFSHL